MSSKPQPAAKAKKFHLSGKDREYLTTNLALLLKAAVPVGEALESLTEGGSPQLKKAVVQLTHDIDNGISLANALERAGIASGQTLALINLGERSGNLVANLEVAARQEQKQRIFRAKVRSAMLYPSFVLGMTAIIGLAVSWFLLPRLSETFGRLKVDLPPISRALVDVGNFLKADGYWFVPSLAALIVLLALLVVGVRPFRDLAHRFAFHIPGVKQLLYEVETARFGYLLGTLLESGLSVTESLELLATATTAPRHRTFYTGLKRDFEDGYSFKIAFERQHHLASKLLPISVRQMIIAAERSGALATTLTEIGNTYEDKADITTKNLEVILEPMLLLIVAGGVLLVAVAVIMPIYGLLGGLDQI